MYKCRLKYNYGDLDKILYQCEHFDKNSRTPKVSFSSDLRRHNSSTDEGELTPKSLLHLTHAKSRSAARKKPETQSMSKTQGSAYFRGISRDKWQRLFNSGRVDVPVGMHNPKYAVLQR